MSYLLFRSDGIPLAEFKCIEVYRDGLFVVVSSPVVNDVIVITGKHEVVSYTINAVHGNRAFPIMTMRTLK